MQACGDSDERHEDMLRQLNLMEAKSNDGWFLDPGALMDDLAKRLRTRLLASISKWNQRSDIPDPDDDYTFSIRVPDDAPRKESADAESISRYFFVFARIITSGFLDAVLKVRLSEHPNRPAEDSDGFIFDAIQAIDARDLIEIHDHEGFICLWSDVSDDRARRINLINGKPTELTRKRTAETVRAVRPKFYIDPKKRGRIVNEARHRIMEAAHRKVAEIKAKRDGG